MTDTGSFGQNIAARKSLDSFKAGENTFLPHLIQNEDYRTNLGFSEAGFGEVVVGIDLYDRYGTLLGSTGFGMGVSGYKQFNEFVKSLGISELDNGYIRVRVVSGEGMVFPYLSVVDNRSGDAIFVTP